MKNVAVFLFTVLGTSFLFAQQTYTTKDLMGAWETTVPGDNGQEVQIFILIDEGFHSSVLLDKETQAFIGTQGGSYRVEANKIIAKTEFHSRMPDRVGQETTFPILSLEDEVLTLGEGGGTWQLVDNGTPGKLAGAWLISGRKREGEIRRRDTSGPRKTMKILSGTRFQWIAYHIDNKAFLGTGGGTYTTKGGKYVEKIEFFSKDASRVGAELSFDYELIEGEWHHQGLSSKGQPIYEIWSLRK